jgi:hypothetical protein
VSARRVAALERVQAWAAAVWLALVGGGGLGFVARDLLGAVRPLVALAWVAGAALLAAPALARRGRAARGRVGPGRGGAARVRNRSELGQATIEWVALVLACALALGALAAFGPSIDGRTFGASLAHRMACAVRAGCDDGDRALARAYGERDGALVRAHAPNLVYERGERELPVDWRRCRERRCATAPDEPALDVHRSDRGAGATVFTRLLRRGGRTFIQYWLYFPDSNTTFAGADRAWEASWLLPRIRELVSGSGDWPGYHRDDWESVQVRLDPDGSAWVRASSHGHYQGCKHDHCRNRWVPATGWSRVSYGSHAGHIPMPLDPRERTTTADGLRLIPLETHPTRRYRRLDDDVEPPWRKRAYHDPEGDES